MQNNEKYYDRAIITALRLAFLALIVIWSFLIIEPFIMVTLWGIIIAVAIYPLHKKLTKLLGGKESLSAILLTLVGLAILIVPSAMLVNNTVGSMESIADQMQRGTINIPPPNEKVAEWPVVGKTIYKSWHLASENLEAAIETYNNQIKEYGTKVLKAASDMAMAVLLFLVSIIIAGVLLPYAKPGQKSAEMIFRTLVGDQGKNFVKLSAAIIRSVVQGILGIAVIQAVLAGIGMSFVGIPAAGLLALTVLLLAIVQLPPVLILGPVAIYSFTILDTSTAVIFSIYLVIVSISDTFLKPLLLGRGVDVPMLTVLLGAIGGMIMSGILGLFLGPVVLTIAYEMFKALLKENNENTEEAEEMTRITASDENES